MQKFLILYLILLVSCGQNSLSEVKISDVDTNKIQIASDTVTELVEKENLGLIFDHARPFEVLSFHKGITLQYTGPDDTSECKNWNISKENLVEIFRNSEPINGTTWDLAFVFTSCEVNGQIKQNGEVFDYSINGGAWFSVKCRDTSLLFGDYNQKHSRFFLDIPERH